MKTGLAVCAALLLDPFDMVAVSVEQKTELQPQIVIDKKIDLPKRAGRRQTDVRPPSQRCTFPC